MNAGTDLNVHVEHLGRVPYADAYGIQLARHATILNGRARPAAPMGVVLTVEHEPVLTVSRRPGAASNVLADEAVLAQRGVTVEPTDRGGDVTYHGPGQLVVYPILDLQRLGIRLHDHLRLLEQAVIDAIATVGLTGHRDPDATGVWLRRDGQPDAKVAAMGVRVRKWVSLHGLALNVAPDLTHFGLIVPCGLVGRPVTSLKAELGDGSPSLERMRDEVVAALLRRVAEAARIRPAH